MASDRRLARAMFGSLCRALRAAPSISVVDAVDLVTWRTSMRQYRFVEKRPDSALAALLHTDIADAIVRDDGTVSTAELLEAARREFRATAMSDEAMDRGMAAIRRANELVRKARHAAVATTGDVEVSVCTAHVPGTDFQFVYRVRVRSLREEGQLRLCTRHIRVEFGGERDGIDVADGDLVGGGAQPLESGVIETPRDAPGVVGQLPVLGPGQTFEYHSNTSWLPHAWGNLSGSYGLVDLETMREVHAVFPTVEFEDVERVDALAERERA